VIVRSTISKVDHEQLQSSMLTDLRCACQVLPLAPLGMSSLASAALLMLRVASATAREFRQNFDTKSSCNSCGSIFPSKVLALAST